MMFCAGPSHDSWLTGPSYLSPAPWESWELQRKFNSAVKHLWKDNNKQSLFNGLITPVNMHACNITALLDFVVSSFKCSDPEIHLQKWIMTHRWHLLSSACSLVSCDRMFLQRSGENGCCLQTLRAHLSEETSQEKMAAVCRPWVHICQRRPARRKWLLCADPESTSVRGDQPGENGCCVQTLRAHLSEETSQEKMAAVCRSWEHICQRRPARRKWLLCADPESTSVRGDQPGENGCCLQILRAHLSEETSQEKMAAVCRSWEHICQRRPARRKWGISPLTRPAFHINHSCGYFWLHVCGNFILPLYINIVGIHSTGLLLILFLRPA